MQTQYRPLSDKELIQLATQGDSAAAEFLLNRWAMPVRNTVKVVEGWRTLRFSSVTAARKIANTFTKETACSG